LIWPNGFREKQLYKSTNQKQELPVVAMFISLLTDREKMCNLYRGPSINASYQVWIDLAKRFQRRRFFSETVWPNQSKLSKKLLWKIIYKDTTCCPHPLTNMDDKGNSCF
jgi:hypothetical protein